MSPRTLFLALLFLVGCAAAPKPVSPSCHRYFCDTSITLEVSKPIEPRHLDLGPINVFSTLEFRSDLQKAVEAKESLIIVDIDSPGGSVTVMLGLMKSMADARKDGMTIKCHVDGMAASAAAVIFETSCDIREMAPTATLLFHEPALGDIGGKEGDLRRAADSLADTNKRMAILVAPHLNMTPAQYMAWIADRDRWIGADEAKAMGAVDVLSSR